MKRILILTLSVLVASTSLFAQKKSGESVSTPIGGSIEKPKIGSWSVGISFNALGLGKAISQPNEAEAEGIHTFITSESCLAQRQMYLMQQSPLTVIEFKKITSEHWSSRITFGLSGSHLDNREYVFDDLARLSNPSSEARVVDHMISDMNTLSLGWGKEYRTGKKNVEFIMGASLIYAIGGGSLNFKYGNTMTPFNPEPTTSGELLKPVTGGPGLNEFIAGTQGIDVARPTKRYSIGYSHGLGVQMYLGLEYFFTERASVNAKINFMPIMAVFQNKTYTSYEGYSTKTGNVEKYNDMISPGTWGVLYGTQSTGINIGISYYL